MYKFNEWRQPSPWLSLLIFIIENNYHYYSLFYKFFNIKPIVFFREAVSVLAMPTLQKTGPSRLKVLFLHYLIWPSPDIKNFTVVNAGNPIGPRACNF